MPQKTYAQLNVQTTVQDTDLMATYRSAGPLKSLTALIFKNYVGASYAALSGATFTGAVLFVAATEGAPNGFAAETNTGFYRSGAGNWDLAILGTRRLNVSATGLQVYGGVTATGFGGPLNGAVGGVTPAPGAFTTLTATAADIVGSVRSAQNTVFSPYTLVLADAGKSIVVGAGCTSVTVPANASVAFSNGVRTYIFNTSASPITIPITSDTLDWFTGAAVTAGTRTLANGGWAVLWKYAATTWYITGQGLT